MTEQQIRDDLPMAQGLHYELLWFMREGFTCTRDGLDPVSDADRVAGLTPDV